MPNQPDQERTKAYLDSSGPESRSDAHCATIVGDWEEPSGESRLGDVGYKDDRSRSRPAPGAADHGTTWRWRGYHERNSARDKRRPLAAVAELNVGIRHDASQNLNRR